VRFISALSATLSTFRERLSLLYVLNDVLHHSTNTFRDTKAFIASATVPYLPALVNSVKSAPNYRAEPIDKVLKLWFEKRYFSDEEFAQVTGEQVKRVVTEVQVKEPERKPLVKPARLGTTGDPHWLLPVSCMVEVMVVKLCLQIDYRNTLITINLLPL